MLPGALLASRRVRWIRVRRPAIPRAPPATALSTSQALERSWTEQCEERSALITISGPTYITSSNDVWCEIATVFASLGASIEDAAGTFMQMPPNTKTGLGKKRSRSDFMVSAFDTQIAPFARTLDREAPSIGGGGRVAVSVLVKASISLTQERELLDQLEARFPALVCTVTVGGYEQVTKPRSLLPCKQKREQGVLLATLRLFGDDKVGQLAAIAQALHDCHVTIVNLLVTTGFCDEETCEFFERMGGPLSENVIQVAALDPKAFKEEGFADTVIRAAARVGYNVHSIIIDNQAERASALAKYYLERKQFLCEWSKQRQSKNPWEQRWVI